MLPLEKLTLSGKAVATCFDVSPEKGTKCIAVTFEIVDDDRYAGERTPAWKGWFSGKATERTIESLQYMGFASDDLSLLEECDEAKCAEILPNIVQLVLDPEQGQDGNWYQRVQWVNRAGYGKFVPQQPLKGAELKAFAAQMRSAFRNARGPQKQSGVRPAHPNAPGNRDDIPF